jgi:hypothetical protein
MNKAVSNETEVDMKKTDWNYQAVTWYCDMCGQHWLTEPVELPETWRLVCLADLTLDGATPSGTSYTLTITTPDPSVCPACGATMTQLATDGTELGLKTALWLLSGK